MDKKMQIEPKKLYTNKTNYDRNNFDKPEWLFNGKVIWYPWSLQRGSNAFNDKDIDYWLELGLVYWCKPDAWILK